MGLVRRLGLGIAAAVTAGTVVGTVARVMMRAVRLARGTPAEFSWAASVGIVGLFVLLMIPGAVLAALRAGRGRTVLLWVGGAILLVPALGVGNEEAALGEPMPVLRRLLVIALGLLVLALVLGLPLVTRLLVDRWTRAAPAGPGAGRPG